MVWSYPTLGLRIRIRVFNLRFSLHTFLKALSLASSKALWLFCTIIVVHFKKYFFWQDVFTIQTATVCWTNLASFCNVHVLVQILFWFIYWFSNFILSTNTVCHIMFTPFTFTSSTYFYQTDFCYVSILFINIIIKSSSCYNYQYYYLVLLMLQLSILGII